VYPTLNPRRRRSQQEATMRDDHDEAKPTDARTPLQPIDHAVFFAALDAPPVPTEALRQAFKRHRETVVSK
jgi:hypothetical protein